MTYEKISHIFKPDNHHEWMFYYAAPVSAVEFDTFIRVFFTTRNAIDEKTGFFKTHIAFLDCDKKDPSKVLAICDKPVLEFGPPGTFDEHGTMIADVIQHNGKYYMYYMGWQRSDTVPYMNMLGLAVSDDGTNFTKVSEGPVMGNNRFMPLGIGNVSVLLEEGVFHMWYTHYRPWIPTDKGYRPNYDIRYAWSENGLDWNYGPQCIAPADANEALATPCVRHLGGKYHMWYSYRPGVDAAGKSGPYRIGYATAEERTAWTRRDAEMTLGVSAEGWDAEMVCYPDVLETSEGIYMFYCGNGYGREGFGFAKIKI